MRKQLEGRCQEMKLNQNLDPTFHDNSQRTLPLTSRPALSAVQVLKIRRPNYSDFSVKTMVIMKLLQQQNGNTVVVKQFKSEFYVEI